MDASSPCGKSFSPLVTRHSRCWAGWTTGRPLPLERMREQFLPEFSRRGKNRRKLQYAVEAAADMHGGAEPDLFDEVA